jgi:hypothetical protein
MTGEAGLTGLALFHAGTTGMSPGAQQHEP